MAKKKITNLSAQEIEAMKIGRRALPEVMRGLVALTNDQSPSQRRQAIEVYLRYVMADRNLQMQADGTISEGGGKSGDVNITLNRMDVRLVEVMHDLPPHLKVKFATLMDEIESYMTTELGEEVYSGVIEGDMRVCKCGCGQPVSPKANWVHGHHLRKGNAPASVEAARAKFKAKFIDKADDVEGEVVESKPEAKAEAKDD